MTLNHILDISPRLEALWRDTLTQETLIMATIAEFKAQVLAKIAEMQQASADERAQVLAAIDALKSQVGDIVPDSDVAEVNAAFDATISGIGSIYTPEAIAARAATRQARSGVR